MTDVNCYLKEQAADGLLPWSRQVEAAELFHITLPMVEERTLELGILPARYQRNRTTFSTANQLTLFRSHVAVIGCGGLGGYMVEELARVGVGRLSVVDPDVFEEHNLNRQLFSSIANIGTPKVAAAEARVAAINPAVSIKGFQEKFSAENGESLLKGCSIVLDALDSIPVRLELSALCTTLGVPLVHGAIAGWYGHVASQLAGEDTVSRIYKNWHERRGVEQQLGNPSFTPALVASIEVAELCKILVGKGSILKGRQLTIDLLEMETYEIKL